MKKNRKLFINSLFATSAFAPVLAVIACGNTAQLLTPDEIEINSKLSSSSLFVEKNYQETLIKKLVSDPSKFDYSNDDSILSSSIKIANKDVPFMDLAKYYILETIFADNAFFKNFANTLLTKAKDALIYDADGNGAPKAGADGKFAKVSYADVDRYHLLREIPSSKTPWIADKTEYDKAKLKGVNGKDLEQNEAFEELVKLFFKNNFNGFKNNFYRFVIALSYLNISKDQWSEVFHGSSDDKLYRENTVFDPEIADNNFVLTKEVIKTKPFFTWSATLEASPSKPFITAGKLTSDQVDTYLNFSAGATGTMDALAKSTKNKKMPSYLETLFNAVSLPGQNVNNIVGFGGVATQTSVGTKSLSFNLSEMRKNTGKILKTKVDWDESVDDLVKEIKKTPIPAGTSAGNDDFDKAIAERSVKILVLNLINKISSTTPQADLKNDATDTDLDTFAAALKATQADDAAVAKLNYLYLPEYNTAYNGYIFEEQVKQNEIELFAKKSTTVAINKVVGIMPTYVSSKFEMAQFDQPEEIIALEEKLYFLDSKDLYDDAISYYTNRKTDPVFLEITDKYLKTLATDTWGFPWVQKD